MSAVLVPGLEFEPALSMFQMKEVFISVGHQSDQSTEVVLIFRFKNAEQEAKRKWQVEYTRIKRFCMFVCSLTFTIHAS